MMAIKDRNGATLDKYDYVHYSPDVKEGSVTPDEKFVIGRIVSITDGMKRAEIRVAFVSLAGNNGRVATIGKIDPATCLLVAKASGTLVPPADAKVLPVKGEVVDGKVKP